jgi:cytochrome b-561 domain containing protein 2
MSDNNYFTYKLEFKYRLLLHWVLTAIAGVLITVASVCIFMNKVNHGKSHFQSIHGILGLATVCCTLLSIILGVFTRFSFPLRNCVRPICTKISHSLLGVVTYVLAMTTIGFAVYSEFFIGLTHDIHYLRIIVVCVIGVTGIYVLVKPVALLYARLEEVVRQ